MQCIWSTTAKSGAWRNSHCATSMRWAAATPIPFKIHLHSTNGRFCTAAVPTFARISSSNAAQTTARRGYRSWVGARHDSEHLSPPQLSRAAAQAVRMCAPREALYIVNSLHYSTTIGSSASTLRPSDRDEKHSPESSPAPEHIINFNRSISPRLAAHGFLHKLVRQGFSFEASRYAELMMQQNIRLNKRTTEAIVRSLCARGTPLQPAHFLNKIKGQFSFKPNIADIPSHLDYSGLAAAQSILACARRFGQQRTERMYENLISSCIIQGEIIVASLLFVLLVKDWQSYKASKTSTGDQVPADTVCERGITTSAGAITRKYPVKLGQDGCSASLAAVSRHTTRPPYPQLSLLTAITAEIRTAFRRDTNDPGGDQYLQASLQALANLVSLVDNGQLHFGNIASLITTLYNCPKTTYTVQVHLDGKEATVNAYSYFHSCLSRMVASLKSQVPPLDTRSCNSLLYYSLRHRIAPRKGSKMVLDHMTQRQILSTTTANILLHTGTRLRRADISQVALEMLHRFGDVGHLFDDGEDNTRPRRPAGDYWKGSRKFTRALKRIRRHEFEIPKGMQALSISLEADLHTLVTYITHLTATGRPEVVAELLFKILPELGSIDHPSWGDLTPEEREALVQRSKEACIRRSIQLGPRLFTALITALGKAGKTGLAERTWILAQNAERASWDSKYASNTEPWLLPIHAYTAMIQCYAAESRHAHRYARDSGGGDGLGRPDHEPLKPWVRGWARFLYKKRQLYESPVPRRAVGHKMAAWLFRSMMSGGHQVISSLFKTREVDASLAARIKAQAPIPDARFFNAILRLFRSSLRRPVKRGHGDYARIMRRCLKQFAVRRTMSREWSPLIQEVGKAMIAARYPIPLAYRPLFVGRLPEATRQQELVNRPCLTPFAFPEVKSPSSPIRLPTTKTRGLPIRRRRARRWVSKKCQT